MILTYLAVALFASNSGCVVAAAPFLPGIVSGEANDYNLNGSDDGALMVFARSGPDFEGAKIMLMERGPEGYSSPEPISFSDARYKDSDPWLSPDGRQLFFVSDRPADGRGADRRDLDIWRSVREAGGWGEPQHLGAGINSPGEELGPELHGGRLYFSSTRCGGAGGLDIYGALQEGEGFARPEPLPAPLNSESSESDFTLSRDGRTALMWRAVGGHGLIHRSQRTGVGGWSDPEPLDASVNPGPFNFTPQFSPDDQSLLFATTASRAGQPDRNADVRHACLFRGSGPSVIPVEEADTTG